MLLSSFSIFHYITVNIIPLYMLIDLEGRSLPERITRRNRYLTTDQSATTTATQGNDFTGTLDDNWGLVREVGLGWALMWYLCHQCICNVSLLVLSDTKDEFRGQVVIVTSPRRYLSPKFLARSQNPAKKQLRTKTTFPTSASHRGPFARYFESSPLSILNVKRRGSD